ncbi:MAG: hypothetical protein RLO81_10000 [Fulvivirga sp.]|uniref:hypothetical protein n=1 Tax=Fulvivirga sp. TaxID=1931237 RepID=UPI0032ED88AA
MIFIKKIVYLNLACLFIAPPALCQFALEYDGSYQVLDYEGIAQFEFQIVEGDTVFTGDFHMSKSDARQLIEGTDESFDFAGTFKNGTPVGSWSFNFGNYKASATKNVSLDNYRYQITLNGTQHSASGNLINGKPDGKWMHTIKSIEDGQTKATLFNSEIEFSEGVPQKNFQIQNEDNTLIGRFLRDGIAHDVWELYSSKDPGSIETWKFDEGRLVSVTIKSNDTIYSTNLYSTSLSNPISVNLDDKYLEAINLHHKLTAENYTEIQGGVNSLLKENVQHYTKINNILSALGNTSYTPEFIVKINHNPLTNNELKIINSSKELYTKANETCNDLLSNTQLSLLKLSDEETANLVSTIEAIQRRYLVTLSEIFKYQKLGILEYVPRSALLEKLLGSMPNKRLSISYSFNDTVYNKEYIGPKPEKYDLSKAGVEAIEELTHYLSASINSINEKLMSKLTREQQELELMMFEEKIIQENDTLHHLIDSLLVLDEAINAEALKAIKSFAKKQLSNYSQFDVMSEKQSLARELITCFNQLAILSNAIHLQGSRSSEIRQVYLDEVWNPFTATLMEEEVKKHIISAYFNKLLPYVFDIVATKLNCNNATDIKELLSRLYDRMLQLRDEETKRLERKLKKENDPLEILALFSLKSNLSEFEE